MRSELINQLSLSTEAKVLLRSAAEWFQFHKEDETNGRKWDGIPIEVVYVNSRLPFGKALRGCVELSNSNLMYRSAHGEDNFVLFYKTLLKEIAIAIDDFEEEMPLQKYNVQRELQLLMLKIES